MRLRDTLALTLLATLVACSNNGGAPAQESDAHVASSTAESIRAFRRNGDQIVADTFSVRHDLRDSSLTIVLDTDMGDGATLMVSVSRNYRERGSGEEYVVNYFTERTTVGQWRLPRTIKLNQEAWNNELEQRQRVMATAGEPFTVSRISDTIDISFVVPVNQDPPFQRWNANLFGSAVEQSGELRVLRSETKVRYPVDTRGVGQSRYADPLNLTVDIAYRSSAPVPLMAELNPSDPLLALASSLRLEVGGKFRVLERVMNRSTPWYRVEAAGGEFWVNSTALIGRQVSPVD